MTIVRSLIGKKLPFVFSCFILVLVGLNLTAQIDFSALDVVAPPNSGNPETLLRDRFGNEYSYSQAALPQNLAANPFLNNSNTATGYFNPIFSGVIPIQAQAAMEEVLQYVSSAVLARRGLT